MSRLRMATTVGVVAMLTRHAFYCSSCERSSVAVQAFVLAPRRYDVDLRVRMTTTTFPQGITSSYMITPTTTAAATSNHLIRPASSTLTITVLAATTTSSSNKNSNIEIDTTALWNRGLNFGKGRFKFYSGFDEWMKPFPLEDREAYPEVFSLPKGVYEIQLAKPLGIVFEEIDVGRGLVVKELMAGGNADQLSSDSSSSSSNDRIQVGDVLVGITAVKVVGAKYERRMIPARNFDFDTMAGAVASNDLRWGCINVILNIDARTTQ